MSRRWFKPRPWILKVTDNYGADRILGGALSGIVTTALINRLFGQRTVQLPGLLFATALVNVLVGERASQALASCSGAEYCEGEQHCDGNEAAHEDTSRR